LEATTIDLLVLKEAGLVSQMIRTVKVILAGEIDRAVNISGLLVTKGAQAAIEKAGGSVQVVQD